MIFERIVDTATVPTYADAFAAGMDLYSPIETVIPARSKINIKLGIKTEIPERHYLRFEARSGTSWNKSIEVGAGIIDENYRKELGLVLYNHGDEDFPIAVGQRVAQAILHEYKRSAPTEGKVNETDRGGLGSTGS